MIKIIFSDGVENVQSSDHLYQWDKGQQIEISGLGNVGTPEIHIGYTGMMSAVVVNSTVSNDKIYVNIPNKVLMTGKDLRVHINIATTNSNTTIKCISIPVIKRNMPENYVISDGDLQWIEEFKNVSVDFNNRITSNSDDLSDVTEQVNELKSDLAYYTDTQEEIVGKTYEELPTRDTSYYGFANPISPTKSPLKMIKYYNQNWVSDATFYCRVITSDNVVLGEATAKTNKSDKSFSWLEFIFETPINWDKYSIVYVEIVSRTENQCVTRISGSATNPLLNYDTTTYRTFYKSQYADAWCNRMWVADIGLYYYLPLEFYCINSCLNGLKLKNKSITKEKLSDDVFLNLVEKIDFDLGLFDKVGACGDSFTYGSCGNSSGEYISLNSSWFEQLMRRNGVRYYKNYSKGGMTTRSWITYSGGLPKALTEDACDCYLLGFGINDSTDLGIDYLGTLADIKADYTQNGDTFYGNYGKIISQLKEHSPSTKIFLFPIWYNNNHQYKTEYNNAIKNIADKFNFAYYINIFEDDFFNTDIYKTMPNAHPSVLSYNGMSHAIERLINKKIKDNWNDFVYSIVG